METGKKIPGAEQAPATVSILVFEKDFFGKSLASHNKNSLTLETQNLDIIFICSSLEPGKDGVGDYTRKLACALLARGHRAAIIALNDRRMEGTIWQGVQVDNNVAVSVMRLSESLPWKERLGAAKKMIAVFKPSWISLQYVPFGFHLKGLPFNLGNKLKQLAGKINWHVMFHELAVNRDESLKFRIWSSLQVKIIRSVLKTLRPSVIHTNTELYKYRIKEIGFEAGVLPLFSNIGRMDPGSKGLFDDEIPGFISCHRADYITGTLFGSFDYKRWDMRSLLNKFTYRFSKKRVLVASIGRMSAGNECWEQLQKEYPQVTFVNLGEKPAPFISWWLSFYTDFGILTTLPELAGKSGSFMAFKEHGVPVVCKERTPSLAALGLPVEKGLIEVNGNAEFQIPVKRLPVQQLDIITKQFIEELENKEQLS